ncbi:MAG: RNA polymerase sigma factor [Candidatus Tectomicrobia bacterium]|nr:RNA polymerase sigma factor [Candidatus Tectomicrobia bacterium]
MEGHFEQLVTQYQREIYRYILRLTRSYEETDDLFQETFLKAYKAYNALPEEANTRAWLFKIATNLCKNYFRGVKRRRVILLDDELSTIETVTSDENGHYERNPEQMMISKEMEHQLLAIIDRLPFKQKAALIQRKFDGLEYDNIGANLGCSQEAARANVFQAVKKIREELEEAPRGRKINQKKVVKTTGEKS